MNINIDEELIALLGGAPQLDYANPYCEHGSGGKASDGKIILPPHQPSERATEFADALLEVIAAKVALETEERRDTYYGRDSARHKDAYGKAVTRLWNAVGRR